MRSADVRRKYIEFFKKRGHVEIPSANLVPENDPTTLFNSSGMQPLISYILGEPHPLGKRLVNIQKAVRTQDIEEVGDNRHTTFFEMLGNWSLGDYFKKEQLPWVFEFLTKELGLDPKRFYVSVFSGEAGSGSAREGVKGVPKDTESISIWKEIFSGIGIDAKLASAKASVSEGRIFTYPATKNWWSRSGEPEHMPPGEPGGPDSEVFFDFGEELKLHEKSLWKNEKCHPNCDCGRFMEIANSVFMQYVKEGDGSLKELSRGVVDFGGGLERQTAATKNSPDVFTTDLFSSIIRIIEVLSKQKYGEYEKETRSMRIIADHIKGAVMMIADGVMPSNKTQGYVLRRLIRRALLHGRTLGLSGESNYVGRLVEPVGEIYKESYPNVVQKSKEIQLLLEEEAIRFGKSLERGMREYEKYTEDELNARNAFNLYQSYGFPYEMTAELFAQRGKPIDKREFDNAQDAHKRLSQTLTAKMFKGGLQDHKDETTKLHTATHLLHQALRTILGYHVQQKGSNITVERLRFDFSHSAKLTGDELTKIESLVNQKIKENLPVSLEVMDTDKALKGGALGFFGERYGEKVKVYTIGPSMDSKSLPPASSGQAPFSREVCGGPHVEQTGVLGNFKIIKEEALGAGTRRIYASLLKD